ncbi:structural maintenance of chromosomes protein 3 isoform X2 [Beta vulgaris subsp. vulgaris]|uniref:structural maintenance of chromosomes protein 3 isoform X2 n=1 Tax=Beta vulgaris subsp. vulgaris TaxID=3555 RepID=UPI0009019766|nr:structural maintenance of chromosomes protein 3 isoform X2 [Beta vulgaris subsp. vulgaris]
MVLASQISFMQFVLSSVIYSKIFAVRIGMHYFIPSGWRSAKLREGAGNQVLSAFVEIVFDNSDNRIPVDKEEVRLRRTIGLKKDEYFLDGKHITKTEVMNLLESAGFSRSNPYYVVQQGKIASLTLMKDAERLDLLKEIGGTRVYEERRRESLKIMYETGNKRKQIIEVVKYLDERLKELDEEKEDLRKYQQLDRQRKSLEYTIYDKELQDARQKLAKVEEERDKVSEKSTKMYNAVLESEEKGKDLDKDFKRLTKEHQVLSKEKVAVEKRRTEAIERKTKLELDYRDMKERISRSSRAKNSAAKQLEAMKQEILESRTELDSIKPSYDALKMQEDEMTKGIMEREKKLSILYQKQGRATQFSSKAARDQWLQKEIDELERVLSSNLSQEQKLQSEIDNLNTQLRDRDDFIKSRKSSLAAIENNINQSNEGFITSKGQRDKLQDERKSLWERENELLSEIEKLKSEVMKAEKNLDHATPGDIRRGLNTVKSICKQYGIVGVCGPVIELLECDERFFTAVEVTAGNSLFHVVVDSDETATTIIRHLTALKGGRVTFIPLNKVKPPYVNCPQSDDVVPLLKKLKFQEIYTKAFAQVFGRTVVCRNLDVAARVARTDGLDCITLEGDQVSKKGGMTGGFYDHRRSKLKFMIIIKQNTKVVGLKQEELEEIRLQLQDIDQKITEKITEQQKVDADRAHQRSEVEQLRQDIADANKQKRSISTALEKKEKLLSNVRTQIEQLNANVALKRAEMGTDLVDHLTPEERNLLSRLNPEIKEMKENLMECRTKLVEIETKKLELETNLSTNLLRRQQELEAIISSAENDMLAAEAESKQKDVDEAKSLVEEATEELRRVSMSMDNITKELKKIKIENDRLQKLREDYEKQLQKEAEELEQLISNKNMLLARQEEYSKRIRELGPLSSDAFDTYRRKGAKELHKMLHKCNEQLQQFSHVNKKALDQYVNFTEQREELQNRQAELDAGDEKIKELIEVLDQRKDESIERTFKGVARNFREVFSELVQGGHGFLVMMKKKDGDNGDDDQDEDGPREADTEGRVEKYIGVKVKVSFTGQGETQSMKQLSGGQKTVVALALIFAIQRCDPAPFYLFDEIDAALDPQYRTAVGNMIRRLADHATTQFITTTFRPELVKVADKIYGVTHHKRVSRVNVVSKDEALQFIERDQTHNADH